MFLSVPAKYGETRRKEAICRLSAESINTSMERTSIFHLQLQRNGKSHIELNMKCL